MYLFIFNVKGYMKNNLTWILHTVGYVKLMYYIYVYINRNKQINTIMEALQIVLLSLTIAVHIFCAVTIYCLVTEKPGKLVANLKNS